MKKMLKTSTAFLACLLFVLANTISALACTAVYVGSDATEDGSTYFGRSEDFGPSYNKVFEITEAATHGEGEMLEDVDGFSMPYPEETCRYSIIRDLLEEWGYDGEPYAEAGVNEYGVSMSATVSTYNNSSAEAADPLLYGEGGLTEMSLGTVILQNSKTAREGVETVAAIIDEYGAGECNAIFIADSSEIWYMEIVSGHQYAAIKLDPEKVSVVPNMMMLDQINVNDENIIASEELVSLPEENGFLVTESDEPGSIHVAKTYSEGYVSHSSYRAWQGMYILNPELAETVNPDMVEFSDDVPNADDETAVGPFALQFEPSQPVTLEMIIQVLQARGEGTQYEAGQYEYENYPGYYGYECYPIGNQYQAEDHIFQIRNELAPEIATIQWQAMGPAEFSIFVPYYTASLTKTPSVYSNTSYDYDEFLESGEKSMYWVFDELAILANENRDTVAEPVKEYFAAVQESIIEQQKAVDIQMQALQKSHPELVTKVAEALSEQIANQVYDIALQTLEDVEAYLEEPGEQFVLSENDVMPVYVFPSELVPQDTDNNNTAEDTGTADKAPLGMFAGLTLVAVVGFAAVSAKRKNA